MTLGPVHTIYDIGSCAHDLIRHWDLFKRLDTTFRPVHTTGYRQWDLFTGFDPQVTQEEGQAQASFSEFEPGVWQVSWPAGPFWLLAVLGPFVAGGAQFVNPNP